MSQPLAKQCQAVESLIIKVLDSIQLWRYSIEQNEVCSSVVNALQEDAQALSDYLQFAGDDLVNVDDDVEVTVAPSRLATIDSEYDMSDLDFELPDEVECPMS